MIATCRYHTARYIRQEPDGLVEHISRLNNLVSNRPHCSPMKCQPFSSNWHHIQPYPNLRAQRLIPNIKFIM